MKDNRKSIYEYFDKTLFWDYKNIRMDKHYKYIIARILDYGDWDDVRKVKKLFTKKQIIETIKTSRSISKRTANYWAMIYEIEVDDIECMKKY